ncbi:uncharacterized protein LOC144007623 [Festucalex cinctus]
MRLTTAETSCCLSCGCSDASCHQEQVGTMRAAGINTPDENRVAGGAAAAEDALGAHHAPRVWFQPGGQRPIFGGRTVRSSMMTWRRDSSSPTMMAHLKAELLFNAEGCYECVFQLSGIKDDIVTKLDRRSILSKVRTQDNACLCSCNLWHVFLFMCGEEEEVAGHCCPFGAPCQVSQKPTRC